MKRLLAFVLLICTTVLSLTCCRLLDFDRPILSIYGYDRKIGMRAKVESNKLAFDKDDVTLDFFYGLYSLDGKRTLETARLENSPNIPRWPYETCYAIYISNEEEITFEKDENDKLIDYESKVNAHLVKFIPFEEAFSNNYGYTREVSGWLLKTNYAHQEKLTIPAEMFDLSREYVYIYIVWLYHSVEDHTIYDPGLTICINVKYKLIGNNKVRLYNY